MKNTWLKCIGSGKKPIDVWNEVYVEYHKMKPSIKEGERLFLYAPGEDRRRIFALAEAAGNPEYIPECNRTGTGKCHWKLPVRYVEDLNLPVRSGILLKEVNSKRDCPLEKAIAQKSHIKLEKEESESAYRALYEKAKPSPIREFELPPSDIAAPPVRIESRVLRFIRDTGAAKSLKALYDYKCQVCGLRIEPAPDRYYVEVHHVRPLGGDHHGRDTHENMLVLCPNHHAMFDFGIPHFIDADLITIRETTHPMTCKHTLTDDVIAYHNEQIHHRPAA
jgi:hypothetical protein